MVAIWFVAAVGLVGLLLLLAGSILVVRAAELRTPPRKDGVDEGLPRLDIGTILKELTAFLKELGKYLGPDPRARAGGLMAGLGLVMVLAALVAMVSLNAR
jgi:hypothetical protein